MVVDLNSYYKKPFNFIVKIFIHILDPRNSMFIKLLDNGVLVTIFVQFIWIFDITCVYKTNTDLLRV